MIQSRVLIVLICILSSVLVAKEKEKRVHGRDRLIPKQQDQEDLTQEGEGTNENTSTSEGSGTTATPVKSFRHDGPASTSSQDPTLLEGNDNLPGLKGTKKNPDACSQVPPIESFVQISSATSPQANKTGGVYFLSDLRDAPQVFFLDQAKKWPQQISFFSDGVSSFRLSPDSTKLLLSSQQGGNEQYNVHLFDTKTKQTLPLLVDPKERIESYFWDPNSHWFVFTANRRNGIDFDLYRYDLSTNKQTLLAELSGLNTVTDVSPDGNQVLLTQYRSVTDSQVILYDFKTKKAAPFNEALTGRSNFDGKFTADGKNIFFLSDFNGDLVQLVKSSLNGSKTPKALTQEKFEIEEFRLDPQRNRLSYVVNNDGYGKIGGFEISKDGKIQTALNVPNMNGAIGRSVSFSPAHGKGSFFFSETTSARTWDIWLWSFGKKVQWTFSTQAQIPESCFVSEKLIRYPSFDQTTIPAYLFLPPGRSNNDTIPFVVYLHGGPESQYRPQFSKIFQYFLRRGFGVFAPNIRGSTGYGRRYTLLDNYKNRMDSVKDVVEGAKWLTLNGYSKKGSIAVYGGSYGGFLVLRTIQIAPGYFSAASESVGITNFVSFLKNTQGYRRALREVEYGPLSDEDFLKSISPMTYLEDIKTPLLIFHGANDPRVPVSETQQIIKALEDKKVPVEHTIFADEGHGNAKLRNIMVQARQMSLFFERHLKVKPLDAID